MKPISSAATLDLPVVAFFGRTFSEYLQFFELDASDLRGRTTLDVAAGPASFTAEAATAGANAVAVDPLFGCTPEALAAYVRKDYARMFAQLRARPELVRLGTGFASIEEAEADRRTAASRFLRDYEDGFLQGRYVGGRLPQLPFPEKSFDLVLCAHLLFIYSARFDFEFHFAACRELVRVSRGEVRIHPVCGADGRPYADLARLQDRLHVAGVESRVAEVSYEFFRGSGSMLVLKRPA